MNNDTNTFHLPLSRKNQSNEQEGLTTHQSSRMRIPVDSIPKNKRRLFSRNDNQEANGADVTQSKWYAIYTKSRFEKKLYEALQNSGFTVYLPMIKEKRIWSDRIKNVMVPLLPSYLFIKLQKSKNHLVYSYPGIVRFVTFEGKCCEINEKEIGLLKNIERYGFNVETNINKYQAGDLVNIVKGPLTGWKGKIDRTNGSRVIFHLEGIHQSLSVDLSSYFVELSK